MLQKPAFSTTMAASVANRMGAEMRMIEKKNSGVSSIFRKLSMLRTSLLRFERSLCGKLLLRRFDDQLLPVF